MLVARGEEGWVAELGRYLGDVPQDASPDMDVIKYWQVCTLYQFDLNLTHRAFPGQSLHLPDPWANRP